MDHVIHGLRFNEEALRELGEARKEPASLRMKILLGVNFQCEFCSLRCDEEPVRWNTLSEIKWHLDTLHNEEVTDSYRSSLTQEHDVSVSLHFSNHNLPSDDEIITEQKHSQIQLNPESPSATSPGDDESDIGEPEPKRVKTESIDIKTETDKSERGGGRNLKLKSDGSPRISYLKRAMTCPECEVVLSTIEECWHHYTTTHSIPDLIKHILPTIQSGLSASKILPCPICKKDSKGSNILKHIILVHLWRPKLKSIRRKRDMLCPICGRAFNYEQNYYLHIRSVHGGIKPKSHSKYVAKEYKCAQCTYTTCETRRLKSHMKYAHSGIKAYSCKHCSYATWERTSLRDHMFRHKDDKPYHCHVCSYQCIQKKQLRAHLLNRHSISLPKTGHTRVPHASSRQHTDHAVELTDRGANTDPPVKRSKSKTSKSHSAKKSPDIVEGRVLTDNSDTPYVNVPISKDPYQDTESLTDYTSGEKQMLHYSLQGPVIEQVTSRATPSHIPGDRPVLGNYVSQNMSESEHHLVLPPGGQVQRLLSPVNQSLSQSFSVPVMNQSPMTGIATSTPDFISPNTPDKRTYQIIQLTPPSGQQQLSVSQIPTPTTLTEPITVTPIYAQNPHTSSNLVLSNLNQVNPETITSYGSFIYVLK